MVRGDMETYTDPMPSRMQTPNLVLEFIVVPQTMNIGMTAKIASAPTLQAATK